MLDEGEQVAAGKRSTYRVMLRPALGPVKARRDL